MPALSQKLSGDASATPPERCVLVCGHAVGQDLPTLREFRHVLGPIVHTGKALMQSSCRMVVLAYMCGRVGDVYVHIHAYVYTSVSVVARAQVSRFGGVAAAAPSASRCMCRTHAGQMHAGRLHMVLTVRAAGPLAPSARITCIPRVLVCVEGVPWQPLRPHVGLGHSSRGPFSGGVDAAVVAPAPPRLL